jgi:hypothetical protein
VIGREESDQGIAIGMEEMQQTPEDRWQCTLIVRLNNLLELGNGFQCFFKEGFMLFRQNEQHAIRMDGLGNSPSRMCQKCLSAEQWAELLGPIVAACQARERLQSCPIAACENNTPAVPHGAGLHFVLNLSAAAWLTHRSSSSVNLLSRSYTRK